MRVVKAESRKRLKKCELLTAGDIKGDVVTDKAVNGGRKGDEIH